MAELSAQVAFSQKGSDVKGQLSKIIVVTWMGAGGGCGGVEFGNRTLGPGCLSFETGIVVSRSIMQGVWSIRQSSVKLDLKNTFLPVLWESMSSFLVRI